MLEGASAEITFGDQIRDGLDQLLQQDQSCIIMGLGVSDPKAIFSTVSGLYSKYGSSRVIETPTSENAITGVGIGLAITGFKPIMIHQRLDFFLLAMDQLVNNAAKWNYMYGGQQSVPLTIRLITGRGWGQGPTHSQNLHSWFTHIPGLKVVVPAFAKDVKHLLISSVHDPNPVIFIEDRWCHMQKLDKKFISSDYQYSLGQAEVIKYGTQLTVVSSGYSSIMSLRAVKFLSSYGVDVELIDLKTLKPLDTTTIVNSVKKTGKLLVIDSGPRLTSFASEIVSQISELAFDYLKIAPQIISARDIPEPTSFGVTKHFKYSTVDIAHKVIMILDKDPTKFNLSLLDDLIHDVPDESFDSPF